MVVRELIALFGFEVDKKSAKTVDAQAAQLFEKVRSAAVVAGAAIAGSFLVRVAEGVGRLGDEIAKSAERLGVGTQALQELRVAAEKAEVDVHELEAGLRVIGRVAFEAGTGSKEAAESFARVGVRVRDAGGRLKSADALFAAAADGIARLRTHTEQAALAAKLFGRQAGPALVPLLKKGSAAIAAMRARAGDLGGLLDDDLIHVAQEWDDSLKDVNAALQGLKNAVGRALLPVMTRLNKAWVGIIARHGEFIRSRIFKVVEGIGRSVGALVELLLDASDAVVGWAKSLDPLSSKFLAVGAAAAALALILALPGGAILVLIGLVGLLIEDFKVWREGGKSAIGDLVASITALLEPFPVLREVLGAVGELFTSTFGMAINLVGALVQLLINVWSDPEQAIRDFAFQVMEAFSGVSKFVSGIFEKLREFAGGFFGWIQPKLQKMAEFAGKVADVLGLGGGGAGGGAAATAAAPVAVGRPLVGGGNSQTSNVEVSVDARGATNPEAVALATARQVELVLERQNRDALAALTVAAP